MKIYLVGGAVRDSLLKLPVIERDWVVVGAMPYDLLSKGYKQVGKDFPVFLHPDTNEEYALARTERKISFGHTGFICKYSPKVTLEEDLRRRDLTVNAIAKDISGKFIDPYSGIFDIQNKILRHVSESFIEDPLRVLRVARFAAKFSYLNFKISPETLEIIKFMKNDLNSLTPERIWKETEIALSTRDPQIYFKILRNCGALKNLFPEIDELFNFSFKNLYNKKISIGDQSLANMSMVSKISNDISVRFSTLCINLGKKYFFPKKNYNKCEEISFRIKIIEKLCKRLKIPNKIRDIIKIIIKYNNYLNNNIKKLTSVELIELFNSIDAWRRPKRLDQLILASKFTYNINNNFSKKYFSFQGNLLYKAFKIASSVNINEIIKSNIHRSQIREKINIKRYQILDKSKILKK